MNFLNIRVLYFKNTCVTETTTWHLDEPEPLAAFAWLPDCEPPLAPAERGIWIWNWGFIAVVSKIWYSQWKHAVFDRIPYFYLLLLVNIYFLIIYQYRLEIRQHCNQNASAFVQVRLSRDVCYATLVRSSSHRAQYEPNRGVKTKHKKNCRYWKGN